MPAGAAVLSGNVSLNLNAQIQKVLTSLASITNPIVKQLAWSIVSGTGADQIDTAFADNRTLTNGTTETLAFQAGATITTPTLGPTVTGTGSGGSLATGNWKVGYTYVSARGETQISPLTTYALTSPASLLTSAVTPLPTGVTSVNWYASSAVGGSTMFLATNNAGTAATISTAPTTTSPPAANTAMGIQLTDNLGDTLSFGHVKLLFIVNLSTVQADYLLVGNSGTNPLVFGKSAGTAIEKIDAGGNSNSLGFYLAASTRVGFPCVLNSNDLLLISAVGATAPINYLIIALGTST